MLRFNSKTKKMEGILAKISEEEAARLDRLVKDGVLVSSRHPSDEAMKDIQDMFRRRDNEKEIRDAEEARHRYAARKSL